MDKTKGTALDIPSDQRVQQKPSPCEQRARAAKHSARSFCLSCLGSCQTRNQRAYALPCPRPAVSKPTVVPPAGRVASVAGAMTPMSVTQAAMQASINYRDQATGLELPSPLQVSGVCIACRGTAVQRAAAKAVACHVLGGGKRTGGRRAPASCARPSPHTFAVRRAVRVCVRCAQLFLQYDSSRNRSVDMREFKQMMFDLDGLKVTGRGGLGVGSV